MKNLLSAQVFIDGFDYFDPLFFKTVFFCSISIQFKLCIFVCIKVRRTDKIKGDKQ